MPNCFPQRSFFQIDFQTKLKIFLSFFVSFVSKLTLKNTLRCTNSGNSVGPFSSEPMPWFAISIIQWITDSGNLKSRGSPYVRDPYHLHDNRSLKALDGWKMTKKQKKCFRVSYKNNIFVYIYSQFYPKQLSVIPKAGSISSSASRPHLLYLTDLTCKQTVSPDNICQWTRGRWTFENVWTYPWTCTVRPSKFSRNPLYRFIN